MELDYGKLGLRVGFEIHQELDTHKLFCSCPSKLQDAEPQLKVRRNLRPTQSELGEVDRAALAEAVKGKGFKYQIYPESVCLVEMDEEPPHPVNDEALDISLEIALLLNAKPVDEVHTMRKIVIDGSNTSGFQRTLLVATDGQAEVGGKAFRIQTICLEEDAARKMGEAAGLVDYRLDRLGIPLVEIATGPDFSEPQSVAKAALYVGQILRTTGKVMRGIGTIRQDINVSIAGGARQEVKGVQELGLIADVVENEVRRQLGLIGIREELQRRGGKKIDKKFIDVSHLFSSTGSKVIQASLTKGGVVLAVRLPKFAGLVGKELQPGRRFGTELSDYAKVYGGVGGIFHGDELPSYGIGAVEVAKVKDVLGASVADSFAIVTGAADNAQAALVAVVDRANQALEGVPEETRRALPNGDTEFMRPLPGAGRMYPETDIPPIPIAPARLSTIKARLPEAPERRAARLMQAYGLSRDLSERITLSENFPLFEDLVAKTKADPTLVATTLEETLISLRREGLKVENVRREVLEQLFVNVAGREIAKEAIPDVLRLVAQGLGIAEVVEKLQLFSMSRAELEKLVTDVVGANRRLVEERGMAAVGALMGTMMEKARGRVDGKLVHELLEKEVKKLVEISLMKGNAEEK